MDTNWQSELYYILSLLAVEGLGEQKFKLLIRHFGSARNVFEASDRALRQVEGLGPSIVRSIKSFSNDYAIRNELAFIEQHDIKTYYYFDKDYPERLKQIPDAPIVLFSRGNLDLNHPRQIGLIGTRHNSEYGRIITEELLEGLLPYNVQVVSGLAYGIDIIAHRYCVEHQIPTVAVLAHGLDKIYPSVHRHTAYQMLSLGGLITEYFTGTQPDKYNFPMRNRIVAGLCDMVIVVESKIKGGAIITAKLAASYNREIGAVPGRTKDERSEGCNYLIKRNLAHLISNAEDIVDILGWENKPKAPAQTRLFDELLPDEKLVIEVLQQKECMHIDEIMLKTNLTHSSLAAAMLGLEIQQLVRPLSGKRYMLN